MQNNTGILKCMIESICLCEIQLTNYVSIITLAVAISGRLPRTMTKE